MKSGFEKYERLINVFYLTLVFLFGAYSGSWLQLNLS